jgi:hypothetical protein
MPDTLLYTNGLGNIKSSNLIATPTGGAPDTLGNLLASGAGPAGPTGATGPTGPAGPTGATGGVGATGATGAAGGGTIGTPASAGAAGTAGQIQMDANFAYFCIATNTWHRVAIATW